MTRDLPFPVTSMATKGKTRIDELYVTPPRRFVAARDALARALRSAGDDESARIVAAFRRPTVSVFALNLTARRHHAEVKDLLRAARATEQAQWKVLSGGSPADLHRASDEMHERMATLLDLVDVELHAASLPSAPATMRRIHDTLHAAVTSDDITRATLAAGRLTRDLDSPSAFDRQRRAPRGPGRGRKTTGRT